MKPRIPKQFSGRVEIAITALDSTNQRMNSKDGQPRLAFRVEDTTVIEVYELIKEIIEGKIIEECLLK